MSIELPPASPSDAHPVAPWKVPPLPVSRFVQLALFAQQLGRTALTAAELVVIVTHAPALSLYWMVKLMLLTAVVL
jgi:hypothetical protein